MRAFRETSYGSIQGDVLPNKEMRQHDGLNNQSRFTLDQWIIHNYFFLFIFVLTGRTIYNNSEDPKIPRIYPEKESIFGKYYLVGLALSYQSSFTSKWNFFGLFTLG